MRQAIFIGYRRADTADVAGRLYDGLSLAFGAGKIFKDVDSIPVGADFAAHIGKVLPQCRVFLALIGPEWASARDANDAPRVNDPTDLVRVEIETALATPKLLVVPVLVNNARMPAESDVPDSLRPLLQRHAAILRGDPDFKNDVARLVDALRAHLRTGRLNLQPLGGAARVAANAAGLSGWVVLTWLAIAGLGVTAAVPQLREPIVHAASSLLSQPQAAPPAIGANVAVNSATPTAPPASAVQSTTDTSAPPPPTPMESPPQSLGDNINVVLTSLAEVRRQYDSYYVATLRFQNARNSSVGIAVLGQASRGEMVLTDSVGGSCAMVWNGDTWGTMRVERSTQFGSENFLTVPANGQTQQTIFFSEGRCDSAITASSGLTISGSFFLDENGQRRTAPVFFGGLTLTRAESSDEAKP